MQSRDMKVEGSALLHVCVCVCVDMCLGIYGKAILSHGSRGIAQRQCGPESLPPPLPYKAGVLHMK